MAGMEVPLLSTDSIEWRQVSVPSTSTYTANYNPEESLVKDFASSCVIGNPPSHFVWRSRRSQANMLEIIELSSHKDISTIGLRLVFPEALFPFAFVCKLDKTKYASADCLVLYTLTISGVAYLIRLRNNFDYGTSSFVSASEVLECNTQVQPHSGAITAVTAMEGCLLIGRSDGSISLFQLGTLDPSSPGFVSEIRDDAGFGRLWGILSRSSNLASVIDLKVSEIQQRILLFVLHSDGSFRVWDLLNRSKIFSHVMTATASTGAIASLWVGEADIDNGMIPLAMLHRNNMGVSTETIYLHRLLLNVGERTPMSLEPSSRRISLGEGGPIDVKLTSNKVWILKEDGLIMQDLHSHDFIEGLSHYYVLQETLVADLLFQSSEHSSDDLLWLAYSAFSSAKEEVTPFLSSVFFRALLFPGVHCNTIIRKTLGDYNKHFTDSEFGSFTLEGLKSEIQSLVEHQGGSDSPVSVLQFWNNFSARYANNWCKYNAAFGLVVDPSTGAIGIIRNHTISLCRGLEDMEHIVHGSFDNQKEYIGHALDYLRDEFEREILFEFLQCVRTVSQQLGRASSNIFYESLLRTPHISSEEVVTRLLKILETGYSSSTAATLLSELGADAVWEKELSNHKNLRKFSANLFLSLNVLCHKANSWKKVLDVVESYLKFLVPEKIVLKSDAAVIWHLNGSAVVHSMSQIAKVMFDSVLDVLMLLSYVTSISGQINMSYDDVSKIKLELIPMIHEVMTEWHIIHYLGTTPSESPAIEDFSYKLSSLQIGLSHSSDCSGDKRLWNGKLGKFEISLAHILLLNMQSSSMELGNLSFSQLPNPTSLVSLSRGLISWIISGRSGEESFVFFSNSIDLALILLRNNQYRATEYLLTLVDAYSRKEKRFGSLQAVDGKLAALFHLLGCCLVAQTQYGLHGSVKERKVGEAIRCFFRAASVEGSSKAIQSLPPEAGRFRVDFSSAPSTAAWKLHYFQWAMQLFEQYNVNEAASQFALAALEQVDEAVGTVDCTLEGDLGESVTTVKGRLWANVFTFTLDLNNYHDAYCAIVSNPDEDSKIICLRRFIIVLYERGAVKILCNGQLPLIGLVEKVERELAWKAERSDISAKPNPFKLLYAFEVHRHNWRKAASYIYSYSVRLRAETAVKDPQVRSTNLQERLHGLAAAINALQLVHPSYAWIDAPIDSMSPAKETYPNKKARISKLEQCRAFFTMNLGQEIVIVLDQWIWAPAGDSVPQKLPSYLDIEKLEKEFVLTSAEYLLALANINWSFTGTDKPSPDLIDLLVESSSYDMAFTVIHKFWKGSGFKRELERVFISMATKCCPSRLGASLHGKDRKPYGLLLTSSQDEFERDSFDAAAAASSQFAGSSHWGILEHYLDKYKASHPRLPLIVAGTLLSADSQIDLPLWLVRHFKGGRSESGFGMIGSESNPSSLFRLYVDHGRHVEATNLLIEYMENLASIRPADIFRRKKFSAVWFPYTYVERLWAMLDESIRLGHRSDQCEKLKKLLHGALSNHLSLLKTDSDDVRSCAS